jgi:hypothetical protein
MAIGALIEQFRLRTPRSILGPNAPEEMVQQLAGSGLVTIKVHNGS